ncbi:hypothetical protein acdb102_21630 [Acidothermaceae bacterium B102]|nr:hypothetical protein acdb102_21630 [Acidothermaceae bacterium B102]
MTTTAERTGEEPRTYGNWRRPTTPGLPRLGLIGTILGMTGLVLVIFAQMIFGMFAGLGMLCLVTITVAPIAYRNRAARNGWQIVTANVMWSLGVRRGQNLYRSGIAGPVPYGKHTLPGLLAPSKAYEAVDAAGHPFALIHIPATRHVAVVLACEPEGSQLVDQDTTDLWVALYGRFLAELAVEPGLEAAAVTVETANDPGTRLSTEIGLLRRPGAPSFAAAVLDEIAQTYALGAAAVQGRIALVYGTTRRTLDERPRGRSRRRRADSSRSRLREPAEMATQIGNRLPEILRRLSATGVGGVRAMTVTDVAETMRIAYDPAIATQVEGVKARGDASGTTWDNAGPVAVAEDWEYLRHDSGASITWQMVEAPRGAIQSQVLAPLLEPGREFLRKRVTLIYRPHSPSEAARVADGDVRTMVGQATARKGEARATDSLELQAARQSAAEEAAGAGMTRFALLVTATVAAPADLARAVDAIEEAAGASRVVLRRCYGAQSASFAASLGVGVVLNKHVAVPDAIRAYL